MKYDFGFIAIGDEITDGDIVNTNSPKFAEKLTHNGFNIGSHIICKDKIEDITTSLEFIKKHHENIIVIGGLGPTEDDLTTQAVAKYFNKDLILNKEIWDALEQRVLEKYKQVPKNVKKQAIFPSHAEIIINPNGSANGFKLEFAKNRYIYVFPGPPKECIPMLESLKLNKKIKNIIRKTWNIYNIGESFLAEKLEVIKQKYSFVTFKYRITDSYIELKYFYPKDCPHSDQIIKDIELLLKEYL